ncbi:MAG: hypothetical protein ACQEVA_23670, partial [Myxococcota bacterium]
CVVAFSATTALAQAGGADPSPDDQQVEEQEGAEAADEPVAVAETAPAESKASQERTIPGGTLAVMSYILLWLMTLGFVGFTAKRQSALAEELETLERRMDSVLGEIDDEV